MIIALLTGLSVTSCVWLIFVMLHSSSYPVHNTALIIGTCCVSGLVTSVISFRWRVVKLSIGVACALGSGFMFYYLFTLCQLEFRLSVTSQMAQFCAIASAILGGIFGLLFGIYRSRKTMKLVGAVFGSFLVVSSVGFFLDKYVFGETRTNFNLAQICRMVDKDWVDLGVARVASCRENPVKLAMRVSWVILCVCSLVYQCRVQQSYVPSYYILHLYFIYILFAFDEYTESKK
eukprot:837497_1